VAFSVFPSQLLGAPPTRTKPPPAALGLGPRKALLAVSGHLGVDLPDYELKRLLQMLLIINLEDGLPRRRREHGAVERERVFAAQRSREVVAQVNSLLRLESLQVVPALLVGLLQRLQQIVDERGRLFDDEGRDQAGVRRDEFERPHRPGLSEP